MSLGITHSVCLIGVRGVVVDVEAVIGGGLPRTVLIGLPDTALYEARDRARAAVASTGLSWPSQLVTINLSPASIPKTGSHYDVAIVVAVLAANGAVATDLMKGTVFLGELGLDGRIRPVRGLLPAVVAARDSGLERAVVPLNQVEEASLVEGISVWGAASLSDVVAFLEGEPATTTTASASSKTIEEHTAGARSMSEPDLADVSGQPDARWALEVAAAGRHHLYLHGAPGAGKTLLAERLPGILPELTSAESLEVTTVRSLAGLTVHGLEKRPPLSSPHHSASVASLVGGGTRIAAPGAITLAHRGVLFLDEASNGKCTSFSKEVTDEDDYEPAWRERAAGASDAGGGLPGVHSDGAGYAGRGHAGDLPVSAAVEVSQGQGGRDRASAP